MRCGSRFDRNIDSPAQLRTAQDSSGADGLEEGLLQRYDDTEMQLA
jgi:hypothetical protein